MTARDGGQPPREYLSPQDVADQLNIPLKTIYGWMHKRFFPYAKLGKHRRILRTDLEAWITAKTVEPDERPDRSA